MFKLGIDPDEARLSPSKATCLRHQSSQLDLWTHLLISMELFMRRGNVVQWQEERLWRKEDRGLHPGFACVRRVSYFPGGSAVKNPSANTRDAGSIPGSGRSLGKGSGSISHSSILAWEMPWMEEPGGLQSMGLQESDTTERLNHHRIFLQIIYLPVDMCVFVYSPVCLHILNIDVYILPLFFQKL